MLEDSPGTSESAPSPPAGWYPTPTGGQKYWDGAHWTNLPDDSSPANSPAVPRRRLSKKARVLAIAAVLVIALIVAALTVKMNMDAGKAASIAAEIAATKLQDAADAKDAADAAAQAKTVKDDAEKASRLATVKEIEASVKTMAEKQVADNLLTGPILSTLCSPIGAGSTNDLTQLTTTFECFVAHKDNGDGTQSGYTFHANMNWSTGAYTYGIGKANG